MCALAVELTRAERQSVEPSAQSFQLASPEASLEGEELSESGKMIREHVKAAGFLLAIVERGRIHFPALRVTYLSSHEEDNGRG